MPISCHMIAQRPVMKSDEYSPCWLSRRLNRRAVVEGGTDRTDNGAAECETD